jgi:hypothetical protein
LTATTIIPEGQLAKLNQISSKIPAMPLCVICNDSIGSSNKEKKSHEFHFHRLEYNVDCNGK